MREGKTCLHKEMVLDLLLLVSQEQDKVPASHPPPLYRSLGHPITIKIE